jgi:hypothetical protein
MPKARSQAKAPRTSSPPMERGGERRTLFAPRADCARHGTSWLHGMIDHQPRRIGMTVLTGQAITWCASHELCCPCPPGSPPSPRLTLVAGPWPLPRRKGRSALSRGRVPVARRNRNAGTLRIRHASGAVSSDRGVPPRFERRLTWRGMRFQNTNRDEVRHPTDKSIGYVGPRAELARGAPYRCRITEMSPASPPRAAARGGEVNRALT